MVQQGKECIQGLRLRHYYMLCGSLLRVWSHMASVISDITSSSYLQIVRLKTKDKHKQVGIQIPEPCVYKVREELKQMDMNVKRKHEESKQAAERLPMPPMLSGPSALDLSLPFFHPPSLLEPDVLDLTYSPLPSNMQEQSGYHFSDSLGGILSPSETLQSQQFNVREIIEEMLQKLKAPDPSAAERQSVIQFGGEHNFWGTG